MSNLNKFNVSSNIVATVDNYRYFVTCDNGTFKDAEKLPFLTGLYKLFNDLSSSVRFSLARELLDEISVYKDSFNGISLNINQRIVLDGLLNSFRYYEGIEHEEFTQLLEVAPLHVIDKLIDNRSLPLNFLLDLSFLELHNTHPMFQDLQNHVQYIRTKRKPELIAYARQLVPKSEHMTNEMVLSIAGINLNTYLYF